MLALVLDIATGVPVWYTIIPGNVLDVNTTKKIIRDVYSTLGIITTSFVLDAGYTSKELITHISNKKGSKFISRMPLRNGYPYEQLYKEVVRPFISKGKYEFKRENAFYFGKQKKIKLFDQELYAYVYVDKKNALHKREKYYDNHKEEIDAMSAYEKDWYIVKFVFLYLYQMRMIRLKKF